MKRSKERYTLEHAIDNYRMALHALTKARKRLEAYDMALELLREDLGKALLKDREEAIQRIEVIEAEVAYWLLVSRGERVGRRRSSSALRIREDGKDE